MKSFKIFSFLLLSSFCVIAPAENSNQDVNTAVEGEVHEFGTRGINLDTILSEHNLVIVDFWADWCGPCRRMMPELSKIAKNHPNVYVLKVNIDQYRDLAIQYGIQSLPTLLFFKNKQLIAQEIGSKTYKELKKAISRHF